MTHEDQFERATDAHKAMIKARQNLITKTSLRQIRRNSGAKGLSVIHYMLPYCDYNNLFIVPVAHVLLYGLVASFISYILKDGCKHQLSSATRKIITERGKDIGVTSEFGRSYKDVIQYKGSYRMENWLHFTLVFSHYLFMGDILPEPLREMWELLQMIVLHYCHGIPYSQLDADQAAAALKHYASLVEANFEREMCTYNLHIAVCRLPEQERQRGSAAVMMEFVVERAMQLFKQMAGRRVSRDPEKVFVGDYMLQQALREVC